MTETAVTPAAAQAPGPSDARPRNRRWWLVLALIMAVGLGVRLWYLFGWMQPAIVRGDPLYYHEAANLFADGRGWPDPYELDLSHRYVADAQHPPLTSALLAIPSVLGLTTFLEHQVFDCLLGTLSILLVALTGRRAAGPAAGLVAGGLAAVYPGMWINDPLLMSETTGIFACAAVLWLAYRFWDRRGYLDAALLGVATAAAALARAELLLLAVFLVTPLVLLARAPAPPGEPTAPPGAAAVASAPRAPWGRRLGLLVAAGAACVLAIAPWAVYNLNRFHEPEYLSTGLGTTLAVTHCDTTYRGTFLGWWDFNCILKIKNEPTERSERDVFYREAAYRYIGDHKGELPKVALARAGRTWGVFRPFQQVRFDVIESRPVGLNQAALFSLWALLAAGSAGAVLLRRRRALLLPLLALPGALTVASTMVYGTSRFRAVAEPAVVLLAAVALASVRARFVPRGRHSVPRGRHGVPRARHGGTPATPEAAHPADPATGRQQAPAA